MSNFNEYPKIQVRSSEGKVLSTFGTNTTRGRELAQRDVDYHAGSQAFVVRDWNEERHQGGVAIPWVIGKYNDRLLDSPELPDSCRALAYL